MPPSPPADAADLAKVLQGSRLGRYQVPLSALSHTTSGRPLHQTGVATLLASIESNGWLGSPMTACLVGDAPDGELTPDVAHGRQYLMINGNHRLAALKQFYTSKAAEDGAAEADLSKYTVEVDVHFGLNEEARRLVASSEFCGVWCGCRWYSVVAHGSCAFQLPDIVGVYSHLCQPAVSHAISINLGLCAVSYGRPRNSKQVGALLLLPGLPSRTPEALFCLRLHRRLDSVEVCAIHNELYVLRPIQQV